MYIKLNIKKETFKNHLLKMGYNYDIKQYDDFISSIRRKTLKDISEALSGGVLKESIHLIFGKSAQLTSIMILTEENPIDIITKEYLTELIENSHLDLYLEEKKVKIFSKDIQNKAYKNILFKTIFKNNKGYLFLGDIYHIFFKLSSYVNEEVKKCIALNGINLTDKEKKDMSFQTEKGISLYLAGRVGNDKLNHILEIININNIGIDMCNNKDISSFIAFKLNKNIDILNTPFEYTDINIDMTSFKNIEKIFNSTNAFQLKDIKKLMILIKFNDKYRLKKDIFNFLNTLDKNSHYFIKCKGDFKKKSSDMENIIDIIILFIASFKDYLDESSFYTIGSLFQVISDNKDIINEIKNIDLDNEEVIINYGKTNISFSLSELNTYIQNN